MLIRTSWLIRVRKLIISWYYPVICLEKLTMRRESFDSRAKYVKLVDPPTPFQNSIWRLRTALGCWMRETELFNCPNYKAVAA